MQILKNKLIFYPWNYVTKKSFILAELWKKQTPKMDEQMRLFESEIRQQNFHPGPPQGGYRPPLAFMPSSVRAHMPHRFGGFNWDCNFQNLQLTFFLIKKKHFTWKINFFYIIVRYLITNLLKINIFYNSKQNPLWF